MAAGNRLRSRWWLLLPAIAIALPLLRLLPLGAQFHLDWANHRWLAAYTGEFIREHHAVPVVLTTPQQEGMPYPVFYGSLFYPLVGLFTTYLDAGFVFRLLAVLLTWLQYRLVTAALRSLAVPVWYARGIACLVIWAIYPMTNLYTRGAIPEYVATGLLTCIVASWFLLLDAKEAAARRRIALGIGLMFTLAAGTHPITALYSLPVLALLLLAAYIEHGRARAFWWNLVKALVPPVALATVVLAPWLFALAAFQAKIKITTDSGDGPWFYDGIDEWTTRFSPIPVDTRIDPTPIANVSSPYLDAQTNVVIAILLIGWLAIVLWRNRTIGLAALRSIAPCLVAFAFFTWISLSPDSYRHLPGLARMLQIAYRAITYQNIALLLAVLMLAGVLRRRRDASLFTGRPLAAAVLLGCLALSAAGVGIMAVHASRIMTTDAPDTVCVTPAERHENRKLPETFYGADAYTTRDAYTPLSPVEAERRRDERIPMNTRVIGGTRPLRLNADLASWTATNVQAFPWNHILLDDQLVPDTELRVAGTDLFVLVPPGDHKITLRTTPDPTWRVLRTTSFAVLALWVALFGVLEVLAKRQARVVRAAVAPRPPDPEA